MTTFAHFLWLLVLFYIVSKVIRFLISVFSRSDQEVRVGADQDSSDSLAYQLGIFAVFIPKRKIHRKEKFNSDARETGGSAKEKDSLHPRNFGFHEAKGKAEDQVAREGDSLAYQFGIFGPILRSIIKKPTNSRAQASRSSGFRKGDQQANWQAEMQREAKRQAQKEMDAERKRRAEEQRRTEERRKEAEDAERQRAEREREKVRNGWGDEATKQRPKWWEILEVPHNASDEDIRRSYTAKIKAYHPDRLEGMAPDLIQLATQKTKELNRAYAESKSRR